MLNGNNLVSVLLFEYNTSIYYILNIIIVIITIIIFQVIYIKYKYFIANCIKISVSVYL